MTGRVLILRPQPGADETAERARALGLEAVVAPLFEVGPLAWTGPGPGSDSSRVPHTEPPAVESSTNPAASPPP